MAESQNRNQLGNEVMGRICEHKFDGDLEYRYMVCEKKKLDAEIQDLKERLEKAKEVFKSPAVGCGNSCRTCRETLTDLGKILF